MRGYDLLAAVYLIASGDSLITTILIAYRIYSISNWNGSSTRKFNRIVDILVQSSALYSVTLLLTGVTLVLPGSVSGLNPQFFAWTTYLDTICFAIFVCASFDYLRPKELTLVAGLGANHHGGQSRPSISRRHVSFDSATVIDSSV